MSSKNLRFSKDFNLPVNIFNDEMFDYYRNLYDFWPAKEEEIMNKAIEQHGGVEKWLEYCGKVRDNAINGVMDTDEYILFNTQNMDKFDVRKFYIDNGIDAPICGEKSCYTNETDGKYFISIDLKKANFQAMNYAGVINFDTYADFIKFYGGDEYIANSKYLRQVIFGKMNPKRTIAVEKYMMAKIYCLLNSEMEKFGFKIYSVNSDELIYSLITEDSKINEHYIKHMVYDVFRNFGFEVRIELIQIHKLDIVNSHGNQVDAYVRKNIVTGEEVLKKASTTFFPQIYKLWKGMEITKEDLTFFFEDQLATFNDKLILR